MPTLNPKGKLSHFTKKRALESALFKLDLKFLNLDHQSIDLPGKERADLRASASTSKSLSDL
jgi:hypothetical protein